jgi:conjugal transfer pilus assembly protein TraE
VNKQFLDSSLKFLVFQRNVLAAIAFLLVIALIVLTTFLFFKRERIVIVPPFIEKELWVEANQVSATYLEQYGRFLAQLLFQKSATSSTSQTHILLRHAHPAFEGELKSKLISEEEMLKKQNASYVFYPVEIHVDPNKMEVNLSGDRVFYVAGKQISTAREGYTLSFIFNGSRLLLTGVRAGEKS